MVQKNNRCLCAPCVPVTDLKLIGFRIWWDLLCLEPAGQQIRLISGGLRAWVEPGEMCHIILWNQGWIRVNICNFTIVGERAEARAVTVGRSVVSRGNCCGSVIVYNKTPIVAHLSKFRPHCNKNLRPILLWSCRSYVFLVDCVPKWSWNRMCFLSRHPLSTHICARFVYECGALCNQLLKSMPALRESQTRYL